MSLRPIKAVEKAPVSVQVVQKGLILPQDLRTLYTKYLGSDIIPRSKYPIKMLDDLIEHTPYANLCIKKRVEASVGNGFNTEANAELKQIPTNQWILDNIDIDEIRNAEPERLKYPDIWLEIPILNNEALTYYHISTETMTIGMGRLKGKYVQYAGIKDKQTTFEPFDKELYKKGTHPNGTFVWHIKRGKDVYGKPMWIDGLFEIMKTIKSQIRSTGSYYDNNAQAISTEVYYNQDPTSEKAKKDKADRERNLQGADKNGVSELLHVSGQYGGSEGVGRAYERFEHSRDIISQYNLEYLDASERKVTAHFETPGFMVGQTTAGALGGVEEAGYLTALWIGTTIQPAQRFWYELHNFLFGVDKGFTQFNTIQMPKANEDANNDITITEKGIVKGSKVNIIDKISDSVTNNIIDIENTLTNKELIHG